MSVSPLRNWLQYADHPRLHYADQRHGQLAMRGRRVCRMHGGKAGRKPTHGRYTKAAITQQREFRAILRLLREMIDAAD